MPSIEVEIRQRYAAIRFGAAPGTPIAALHIGEEQTAIATGIDPEPGTVLALDIGSRKTASEHFKNSPPTPGELEDAITSVEDALFLARKIGADGSTMFTMDAAIRAIALIAGLPDQPEILLSQDAIERTFDRLASVVLGKPAAQEGIPASAEFAATLLILRECMHHLKFSSITVTN